MNKETYAELLKSEEWKNKRQIIMKRDNFTCVCGSKRHLQVHHKRYIKGKMPWDIDNKYLITLCRSCHEKEHNIRPISSFVQKNKPKKSKNNKRKKLLRGLSKADKALQEKYYQIKARGKL